MNEETLKPKVKIEELAEMLPDEVADKLSIADMRYIKQIYDAGYNAALKDVYSVLEPLLKEDTNA